ncbi:MAG: hypothetical protein H9W81_09895 [Enterococcus sp.]|nr:hypothetical protein [Enterococcus sp.]
MWNRKAVRQWENLSANLFAAYTINLVDAVKAFGQTDYTADWLYALEKAHRRAMTNLVLAKAGFRKSLDSDAVNEFITTIVGSSKGNEDFIQGMRDSLIKALA